MTGGCFVRVTCYFSLSVLKGLGIERIGHGDTDCFMAFDEKPGWYLYISVV